MKSTSLVKFTKFRLFVLCLCLIIEKFFPLIPAATAQVQTDEFFTLSTTLDPRLESRPNTHLIPGIFDYFKPTDVVNIDPQQGTVTTMYGHGIGQIISERLNFSHFHHWIQENSVQIYAGNFDAIESDTDILLLRRDGGWDGSLRLLRFGSPSAPVNIFQEQIVPISKQFTDWLKLPGVEVITGNFDNRYGTDLALIRRDGDWETIPLALSKNLTFTPTLNRGELFRITNERPTPSHNWPQYTSFAPNWSAFVRAGNVRVIPGDFNGDRLTDLAAVRQDPGWGSIPIAFSQGNGQFRVENYGIHNFAQFAAASNVQIIAGDFNGDQKTDLAAVRQDPGWGSIPIAFSNGNGSFRVENRPIGDFARWAAAGDVRILSGDLNGDEQTDLALVRQTPGWSSIPVAISNGDGSFKVENRPAAEFAQFADNFSSRIVSGDFNGDDKMDIAAYGSLGRVSIAYSDPNRVRFTLTQMTIKDDFDGLGRGDGDFCIFLKDSQGNVLSQVFDCDRIDFGKGQHSLIGAAGTQIKLVDLGPSKDLTIHLREKDSGWDDDADCSRNIAINLTRSLNRGTISCPGGNQISYRVDLLP